MRCNFQIEGSGVKPEDVIIDGGTGYSSKSRRPSRPSYAKDVVLRVDRADGFVARNFLARGAAEHGIYIEETDGYLLDRTKFFWAADYGNLTFTSDHGLYKNCDGVRLRRRGRLPGRRAGDRRAGRQVLLSRRPADQHRGQEVRPARSALAYSGSMGNAVRITHNHIYGNTTGISTDTISAGGHPGFPADSVEIDHN